MVENNKTISYRVTHVLHSFGFIVLAGLIFLNVLQPSARATIILNRNVVSTTSIPGANATQTFSFVIQTNSVVGSMAFEYCGNTPILTAICNAPVGVDLSSAILTAQTGETGFSVHPNSTVNKKVLSRAPVATTPGTVTYTFSNVPNSTLPGTIYIRIYTYSSTDGTGLPLDWGAVSYATNPPLSIAVYVPPFLILCTGVTVSADCSSSTGYGIDLGELSKTDANVGTSQFAAATNSYTGYVTSIQGTTMTAGNRTIPQVGSLAPSQPGTGQFGINLVKNTTPVVGSNIEGSGTGVINSAYTNPNLFRFQSGDFLASSSQSTDFNRYTISYLVNVPTNQSPGRYASTITVIATTTF